MKLYITDEGDPSVGLSSQTYEIDTPFRPDDTYPDDMIWFKKQMEIIFKEFAEGKLHLSYESDVNDTEDVDEFDCLFIAEKS